MKDALWYEKNDLIGEDLYNLIRYAKEFRKDESNDNYCYVYFFEADDNAIKIGISNDVYKRLDTIRTGNPFDVYLLAAFEMPDSRSARKLESLLHHRLEDFRLNGEWFKKTTTVVKYAYEMNQMVNV